MVNIFRKVRIKLCNCITKMRISLFAQFTKKIFWKSKVTAHNVMYRACILKMYT